MSVRGISRLLRLPLFVTAVADALAGYLVAILPRGRPIVWEHVVLVAGASTGLYLYGMVLNDLVDRRRDRLLETGRPLATGAVGVPTAVLLLILTAALAAVCALHLGRTARGGATVMAIGAFAAINLYNLAAKHGPAFVAMTVMGLCRFLNFFIGVAAARGVPQDITPELLALGGPLWVRHGISLFFATCVVTGYSIAARRELTVSSRPWVVTFFAAAVVGFGMIAVAVTMVGQGFHAPMARVFALLLLAALWPGGLWSAAGPERRPEQYGRFIPRMLYWLIVMDAAFVADAWLMTM
ncbi:MAG: UbiA family prenyltransferase [Phycisphaerae bacterium]